MKHSKTTSKPKTRSVSRTLKSGVSRKSMESSLYTPVDIVGKFLYLLNMVKLHHWQTLSYADHKATDRMHEALSENIDKFVEVMLGKLSERPDLSKIVMKPMKHITHEQLVKEINTYIEYFVNMTKSKLNTPENSDLMNLKDELIADLNQFLYLLSLHK